MTPPLILAITAASAVLVFSLILALRPWLQRVALARLEARSSHRLPTPQGAGLGITAVAVAAALGAEIAFGGGGSKLIGLLGAITALSCLGFYDDSRHLGWRLKLAVQIAAAALASLCLPDKSLLPGNWFWIERATALVALVAMVNLVNFIDGIDEITVAHAVPGLMVAVVAGLVLPLPASITILASAALGGLLGFWPLNRHPARMFLGDSGSLPLGLILGWLSLALALQGHVASAALMVLYPLLDGGLTLLRRAMAGKRLTEPHRNHAYQHAVDAGRRAPRVSGTVAAISLACGALAVTAFLSADWRIAAAALILGTALVAAPVTLWLLDRR